MKNLALLLLGMLVSGCSVTVRSTSEPAFGNLSGTYRYSGLDDLKPYQLPNPLIDFTDIKTPCDIEISQINGVFEASYPTSSGAPTRKSLDPERDEGVSWNQKELVTRIKQPVRSGRILPGLATHHRGTRIFRSTDGHLRIIGFFEEKGTTLLLLPFKDHYDYELALESVND